MREFLKGLNLDKEIIDNIMVEYGKHITAEQEKRTNLETEVNNYKTEIANYKTQIDDLNGKITEKDESLKNLQNVTNENKDLKAQLQMSDSNVKKEFMKFVTTEVSSKVNDETDFATALETYKKENPQYFGETVVKKVQSSPNLASGGEQKSTTNDIMNDILRSSRNN